MADTEEEANTLKEIFLLILKFVKIYWKILFALAWPMFLVPFILVHNIPEVKCGFTLLLMAGYWISECFPLAITSLIPLVLFPMFGVLSTNDVCNCYMNDTIMVFMGGLVLAVAIEHCNLHFRIALGVMKTVGCTHAKLLGGFCVVTTFISLWISNTATTAMMMPIVFAVLQELEQAGFCTIFYILPVDPENPKQKPKTQPTKITQAYLMATAYCATFGGTGTLVGTGTNLTFKGIFENTFPTSGGINFTQWIVANIPQVIVNSFLTWIYLRIAYMGYLRPKSKDAEQATIGEERQTITNQVIQEKYKELGIITFHEIAVAILFILCIFLWLFQKPGFMRGWSEAITDLDIRDSTPVIMISILMFFIPRDPSFIHYFSRDPTKRPTKCSEGLITWNVIQTKMPWSLMFLLGSGFAIAKGSVASCMARRVGEFLVPLLYLPPPVIMFLIAIFIGTITEFTSNVGIANITLPVIAHMSVAMKINPIYFMVPATIACSFSFRLPVGTPPNAIISIVGKIPTKLLIVGGCGPSFYAIVVSVTSFLVWGAYVYDVSTFPKWATNTNVSGNSKCN